MIRNCERNPAKLRYHIRLFALLGYKLKEIDMLAL